MAKQLARLLRTDVMADVSMPALAKLLQRQGRKGDTILAHITPEEAEILKDEGGSGTINPATGLPEYAPEDYFAEPDILPTETAAPTTSSPDYTPTPTPIDYSQQYAGPSQGAEAQNVSYSPAAGGAYQAGEYAPAAPVTTPAFAPSAPYIPSDATEAQALTALPQTTIPQEQKPGFWEGFTDLTKEQKQNLLLKGGLGIGTGLIGALQARKAAQQAQQAKGEIAALGAPYQAQGQEMISAARRGELTPANQQQLQAAQAQLAQGVERRGGVGAQQAATQLQAFRQQLLDNQYNYGLKVAQIGDTYAQRAIQTGLTQDKELVALMQGLTGAFGGFMGSQPNQPGR